MYGARPLKRVIQRDVLNPLASKILSGEVKEGAKVLVDRSDRRLVFRTEMRATVVS
jgi:ATP-dependent Clp protease ATP-binding subunit ClpB